MTRISFFLNEIESNTVENSRVYCWLIAYNVFLCDLKMYETHCPIFWLLRDLSTPMILNPQCLLKMNFCSVGDGDMVQLSHLQTSPVLLSVVSVPAGQWVTDGGKN